MLPNLSLCSSTCYTSATLQQLYKFYSDSISKIIQQIRHAAVWHAAGDSPTDLLLSDDTASTSDGSAIYLADSKQHQNFSSRQMYKETERETELILATTIQTKPLSKYFQIYQLQMTKFFSLEEDRPDGVFIPHSSERKNFFLCCKDDQSVRSTVSAQQYDL